MNHTRTCPDCGEEFRPEIVRCSDCGAELVDRHDEVRLRESTGPPEPEAQGDYSPVFTTIESAAMREAAASLAAEGIAFRASGNALGFEILVRTEDRARAIAKLGGREGAVLFAPKSSPSPGCPACGAAVAAGALECPECQLVLGEAGGPCASCGAAVGPEGAPCPFCGAAQ